MSASHRTTDSDFSRAFARQRSPARIAVVNIMDNASGTEKHFRRTLTSANESADITMCRMDCARLGKKYFTEHDHLMSEGYVDWQDVIGKEHFDLVIVTGINRGKIPYAELARTHAPFWNEMHDLLGSIDAAHDNGLVGHTSLICWSAFAALKIQHGVEKLIRSEKLYGLFDHVIETQDHPLFASFEQKDNQLLIPQSRFATLDNAAVKQAIGASRGQILMSGPECPAIWTLGNHTTCIINHPEYSEDTLRREFSRHRKEDAGFPAPAGYIVNDAGALEQQETFDVLGQLCSTIYRNLIDISVSARQTCPVISQQWRHDEAAPERQLARFA